MTSHRRLPLEVDAYQFDGDFYALVGWANAFGNPTPDIARDANDHTSVGGRRLVVGAWVVRDSLGDWQVVDEDRFDLSFEPIAEKSRAKRT